MVNCNICKEKIAELFLSKIKGTYIFKIGSSKKYSVCFSCQKKFKTKEEMFENLS